MQLLKISLTLLLLIVNIQGQISDKITNVNVGKVYPGTPLTIQAELIQPNTIDKVEIAYRQFGERDFKRNEMIVTGNIASVVLPAELTTVQIIEYYFILYVHDQLNYETFPLENPEQQPFKINIQPYEEDFRKIIILSPEPNESLRQNDLLISFSLVKFDSSINKKATKIYLDNIDLSTSKVISGDLIVINPENVYKEISLGEHTIHVELFDTLDNNLGNYDWKFSISGVAIRKQLKQAAPWTYSSSIQLETRQENISNSTTPFNRASISAQGSYTDYSIKGNLYFTNEERGNRQPQNRYFIGGYFPWLKIGYGDNYPIFPDFIMSGKRLRGLSVNVSLSKFNLDIATGTITRKIEGTLFETFPKDSLYNQQLQYPGYSFDSLKDLGSWARLQYGTFDRKLFAVRTIFGKRDESHLGFSYLRSGDDTNSIKYGKKPQENVVLASDILIAIDKRNFDIFGQVGFSATNKDISGGSITDSEIDSMFEDDSNRKTVRQLRNIISKIITVNENLVPLGSKHMPTLSYEGGVALNYFNNSLRFSYFRHGKSYESFGNTFFQTDVKGFNFSDRQRLLSNQLLLSGGYEKLQDNTDYTKSATTTSQTFNFGVSYFPRFDFPNITLGYLIASNENGLNLEEPFAVNDKTNRVMIQLGKEFKYYIKHNALLNISTSTRDDQTYRNLDTRNTTIALSVVSSFDIPLQTMFNLSVNSSKFISLDNSKAALTYTTIFASTEYRMMEDKLKLFGSISPTFGDNQRVLLNANVQYYFLEYLSAQTQLSVYVNNKLYGVQTITNDIIWSFTLRANI